MTKCNITKYLYFYLYSNSKQIFRLKITDETDSNYYIGHNEISKRNMTSNKVDYYEETPELLKEYNFSVFKRVFLSKLKDLEECEDEKVMKKIISMRWKNKAVLL